MSGTMKTDCHTYETWIDLEAAGWLEEPEQAALQSHVAQCSVCQEKIAANRLLIRGIKALPVPPAPLWQRPSPRKKSGATIILLGWAAAAAVAALVFMPRPPVVLPAPSPPLVQSLKNAPPTLATYRFSLLLGDEDQDAIFDAHARRFSVYQPADQVSAFSTPERNLLL